MSEWHQIFVKAEPALSTKTADQIEAMTGRWGGLFVRPHGPLVITESGGYEMRVWGDDLARRAVKGILEVHYGLTVIGEASHQ